MLTVTNRLSALLVVVIASACASTQAPAKADAPPAAPEPPALTDEISVLGTIGDETFSFSCTKPPAQLGVDTAAVLFDTGAVFLTCEDPVTRIVANATIVPPGASALLPDESNGRMGLLLPIAGEPDTIHIITTSGQSVDTATRADGFHTMTTNDLEKLNFGGVSSMSWERDHLGRPGTLMIIYDVTIQAP